MREAFLLAYPRRVRRLCEVARNSDEATAQGRLLGILAWGRKVQQPAQLDMKGFGFVDGAAQA